MSLKTSLPLPTKLKCPHLLRVHCCVPSPSVKWKAGQTVLGQRLWWYHSFLPSITIYPESSSFLCLVWNQIFYLLSVGYCCMWHGLHSSTWLKLFHFSVKCVNTHSASSRASYQCGNPVLENWAEVSAREVQVLVPKDLYMQNKTNSRRDSQYPRLDYVAGRCVV